VLMQKVVDRTATMADSAELRRLLASYQSLATVVAGDAERPGVWWVRGNTWCALKWQKLKDRAMEDDGSSHP
jgi:acyl-CoA-binding protein